MGVFGGAKRPAMLSGASLSGGDFDSDSHVLEEEEEGAAPSCFLDGTKSPEKGFDFFGADVWAFFGGKSGPGGGANKPES